MEKPAHCEFVRFEHKDTFTVVGLQETIPFTEIATKLPALGAQYKERNGEIKNTVNSTTLRVSFDASKEGVTTLFGKEVSSTVDIPTGFVSKEIPAHEYAVICHKGSKDLMKDTYAWVISKWVEHGKQQINHPSFEVYDERFIPAGPDADKSYLEIYFPIAKKPE